MSDPDTATEPQTDYDRLCQAITAAFAATVRHERSFCDIHATPAGRRTLDLAAQEARVDMWQVVHDLNLDGQKVPS